MPSARRTGRGPLARVVARVLIAALVLGLLPAPAQASLPAPSRAAAARFDPPADLPLRDQASPEAVVVFVTEDEQLCAVLVVVADPNYPSKYHRARWMDPRVARLLGLDPHLGNPFDPPTLHRYIYAKADPANMADPSGEISLGESLTTAGNIITMSARSVLNGAQLLRATRVARFFWDSRRFSTISRVYWRASGPAAGRSLHHWLIPQRWSWVPAGLRNAGFNLLEIPGITIGNLNINTWMGFAVRWGGYRAVVALGVESGIKILIPISIVSGGVAGGSSGAGGVSQLVELLSSTWQPEDLQKEANAPGNTLGPLPPGEDEGS